MPGFHRAARNMFAGSFLSVALSMPALSSEAYMVTDDPDMIEGRNLWVDNCEGCHGYGIAGAPIPMNPDEWGFRLSKGLGMLYKHAINGYIGPDYSMMPARGGNDNLKDEEVKLAVDYMVFLASYYINKHKTSKEVNNDSTTN
jgi:cytochrome c5